MKTKHLLGIIGILLLIGLGFLIYRAATLKTDINDVFVPLPPDPPNDYYEEPFDCTSPPCKG